MRQLPLGVRIPDRAVFSSFLPARNAEVVEHLQRVARASPWPAARMSDASGRAGTGESSGAHAGAGVTTTPGAGVTWIAGSASTGKSHLLQATCVAAAETMHAGYFALGELAALGIGALEGLPQLDCVCLDDLDRVVGQLEWERALFALYREIEDSGGQLVASAQVPPALLTWSLSDLGSRFAASHVFQLRPLEEAEQREALRLHAHARGFELPEETARWLQRRFRRDMRTLAELLDRLDEEALIAQRRLTVPFIRSVLRE